MPIPPLSVEPIDQRPQLRVAAAIALASGFCLLPLQALSIGTGQLPVLFLIYGIHTAVAGFLCSWRTRRTILIGVLVCAGFALVGVALALRGFRMAPFVAPLCWIAIGAALAVACARVLGRFRTSLIQRQDELAALSTRLI